MTELEKVATPEVDEAEFMAGSLDRMAMVVLSEDARSLETRLAQANAELEEWRHSTFAATPAAFRADLKDAQDRVIEISNRMEKAEAERDAYAAVFSACCDALGKQVQPAFLADEIERLRSERERLRQQYEPERYPELTDRLRKELEAK